MYQNRSEVRLANTSHNAAGNPKVSGTASTIQEKKRRHNGRRDFHLVLIRIFQIDITNRVAQNPGNTRFFKRRLVIIINREDRHFFH